MGLLVNTKQFLVAKAITAAKKTGDGIAALSALSPKQLQELDAKRTEYLSQKPDMRWKRSPVCNPEKYGSHWY